MTVEVSSPIENGIKTPSKNMGKGNKTPKSAKRKFATMEINTFPGTPPQSIKKEKDISTSPLVVDGTPSQSIKKEKDISTSPLVVDGTPSTVQSSKKKKKKIKNVNNSMTLEPDLAKPSPGTSSKKKQKKLNDSIKSDPDLANGHLSDSTPKKKKQKTLNDSIKSEPDLSNVNEHSPDASAKKKKKNKISAKKRRRNKARAEELKSTGASQQPESEQNKDTKLNIVNGGNTDSIDKSSGVKLPDGAASPSEKKPESTDKASKKKRTRKRKNEFTVDPEAENRTIFIGNVPLKTQRKALQQFFQKYGQVECVRLRGVAVSKIGMSKKEAITKMRFHPNRDSMLAYLRFKEESSVEPSLEANGSLFKEHHLRVDRAVRDDKRDKGCTIFIGNLAWEVEDETLYRYFMECGPIEGVRIVRDRTMGSGKGIAFVHFKSKDAVELALQHDGHELMDRPMRISRAKTKVKLNKSIEKPTKGLKPGPGVSKAAVAESSQKKLKLNFMKMENPNSEDKPSQEFIGMKTAELGKLKKIKKVKVTKSTKKKFDVAHKLAGKKAIAKKSFKAKVRAKKIKKSKPA